MYRNNNTKENICGEYATLDKFIADWRKDPKKDKIRNMLLERGIDLEPMKAEQGMEDVDDFDFISSPRNLATILTSAVILTLKKKFWRLWI